MHLGLYDIRSHGLPRLDDAHTHTIETEPTYDFTYSLLPPFDHWTHKGILFMAKSYLEAITYRCIQSDTLT